MHSESEKYKAVVVIGERYLFAENKRLKKLNRQKLVSCFMQTLHELMRTVDIEMTHLDINDWNPEKEEFFLGIKKLKQLAASKKAYITLDLIQEEIGEIPPWVEDLFLNDTD